MAGGFDCSVVTPERVVVECEARFAAVPAHDGEVGILRQRAPLLTRLDVGLLRIETIDGEKRELFIDGGFAEMVGNRLTILTEAAIPAAELDRREAERLLTEAREMEAVAEADFEARQRQLRKARAQLRRLKS